MSRLLAIALALSLTACGLKGPLTLPAGPAPEPLLGNAKSVAPSQGKADLSTDQKPPRP